MRLTSWYFYHFSISSRDNFIRNFSLVQGSLILSHHYLMGESLPLVLFSYLPSDLTLFPSQPPPFLLCLCHQEAVCYYLAWVSSLLPALFSWPLQSWQQGVNSHTVFRVGWLSGRLPTLSYGYQLLLTVGGLVCLYLKFNPQLQFWY